MAGIPTHVCFGVVAVALCSPCFGQQAAIELLHKMQAALGGADRIAAIRDFEQIVDARTWNNRGEFAGEVRKRVRWVKAGCLRLDQKGPYDTYVLYFDGTSGWEMLPDKRLADLAGGELEFAKKYLSDFMLNVWLADRNPGYSVTSPSPNVLRIGVHNHANEQIDITLDAVSSLPVKQTSVSLADPSHPVPSETRLAEWTVVEGIRFARRTTVLHNGVRLAEITSERLELNRGFNCAGLARKPADYSPEMDRR